LHSSYDSSFGSNINIITFIKEFGIESVSNLSLSARSFNCLDRADIRFIGELAIMEESELKDLKNLGKKSLEEIKAVMEEIGYPIGNQELGDKKEQLKRKLDELKAQRQKNEGQ